MVRAVALRKSTRIWLGVFLASIVVTVAIDQTSGQMGCAGALAFGLAINAGLVLLVKAIAAAFRSIIRRLALRLAFSYFLIGIVPIPLLAALLCAGAYLVAHQVIATRMRREVSAIVEEAAAREKRLPELRLHDAVVLSSDVTWLRAGDAAAWANKLDAPRPILEGANVWLAVPVEDPIPLRVRLVLLNDPGNARLQHLADQTGYTVRLETGRARRDRSGLEISARPFQRGSTPTNQTIRPRGRPPEKGGLLDGEWVGGVYLEKAIATIGKTEKDEDVIVYIGTTSPRVLASQLFAQGVPEIGRIFWAVLVGLAIALLIVYLVALAIAFVLVGSIARAVNRLTRATQAVARGDFSVRVQSRSRDQIGDLARSFDGMAESIQKLLVETARKEKIEAELGVARAIQESFLPESGASWNGFQAVAHFEPVADLGGDYYDILPMPDGRTAVLIGDVSGHGLPTGLLAAGARATLASFVELGVPAPDAFERLEQRTRRSRNPQRRLYTTLAFFAYDAGSRVGTLTNAGHPAPYRISNGHVERLELPAFPIGLLPRHEVNFRSRDFSFAPGDVLVLFTDGVVEAADADEDPFGYERFEALLASEGSKPAQELCNVVLAAISAHVGSTPLEDDRTLLILTFDPA
jgi:serine phosphatase RsbU (regulator of sigma subunit)